MSKWLDSFELITSIVRVNGCDKSPFSEEHSQCSCKPEFPGGPVCTDRSCINYATLLECLKCKSGCQNNRIQRKKFADVEVRETSWKGHGLFTNEDLKKGQYIMEYLGELINGAELSARMDASMGNKHLYVLQLKKDSYIDARHKGTIGRFINHSCEPNCKIDIWTVDGRMRVGIFALTDVEKDAELNFDYQWRPSSRPPTKCHCGTASCRGFLEVMTGYVVEESKARRGLWRHRKDDLLALKASGVLTGSSNSSSTEDLAVGKVRFAGIGVSSNNDSSDNLASAAATIAASSSSGSLDIAADAAASAKKAFPSPNNNAHNVFDNRGRLVPDRILHKRVKVWWEGNQSYFEADVVEHNPLTGKFKCRYLCDDTQCYENLADPASDWSWLDESQEAAVIKKKVWA